MTYNVFSGTLNLTQSINAGNCTVHTLILPAFVTSDTFEACGRRPIIFLYRNWIVGLITIAKEAPVLLTTALSVVFKTHYKCRAYLFGDM